MADTQKVRNERTKSGFNFGAAEVSALCSDERTGMTLLGVDTPKHNVQIYTTKTGRIHVYVDDVQVYNWKEQPHAS